MKLIKRFFEILPIDIRLPIWGGFLKGKWWFLNSGALSYLKGNYEPDTQRELFKFFKKGDVFFDIGAHAGFYTIMAAFAVGDSGSVYAFEPFPKNFRYLSKNIEANKLKNVFGFSIAISDKSGVFGFDLPAGDFSGRISESGGVKVRVETLDSLISSGKVKMPNIIKIDVEGSEFDVLKGGEECLRQNNLKMMIAFHFEDTAIKCMDFLKRFGYKIEFIKKSDNSNVGDVLAYK